MPFTSKPLETLTREEYEENCWMVLSYVSKTEDFPNYSYRKFDLHLMELEWIENPWGFVLTYKGKRELSRLTRTLKK